MECLGIFKKDGKETSEGGEGWAMKSGEQWGLISWGFMGMEKILASL